MTRKPSDSPPHRPFRIGTRGSGLALAQTGQLAERLRAAGVPVEIEVITTRGDTRGDRPVAALGSDGVFVRELERALRDQAVDIAVHSLKDLPTADVDGLVIASVPRRATAFDALVGQPGDALETLPPAAVVGTSSIRRVAQVRALRPDLDVRPVRGNVDTRLARLDRGDYRCLILAAAGLERLGLAHRITRLLIPPDFWPAIGQGALAVQIRSDDEQVRQAVALLDDPATHAAVVAERACLAALAGGCLAPVGGWARPTESAGLVLGARVLETRGGRTDEVTVEHAMPLRPDDLLAQTPSFLDACRSLGRHVADELLDRGAGSMLDRMREASHGSEGH
jgi:hydroxymethylbilane synthase